MLKYGIFRENTTYFEKIKYLQPYQYLIYRNQKLSVCQLEMPKRITEITIQEASDKFHQYFTEACELQFAKNQKHGYKQLCTVSGGMDSRVVFLEMKKKNEILDTITYAQSGSMDERIARKILKNNSGLSIFCETDGVKVIQNRREVINANEGQMYYIGTTGLMQAITQLDTCRYGIIHTGLGGGEIMGDVIKLGDDEIDDGSIYHDKNYTQNLMDMRRCLNFAKTASPYLETASPFLYEDLFEFIMRLPADMKKNRKLYRHWYHSHFQNREITTVYRGKIPKNDHIASAKMIFSRCYRRGLFCIGATDRFDMNPLHIWGGDIENVNYMNKVYQEDIENLKYHGYSELYAITEAYASKNITMKLRAITITGTLVTALLSKEVSIK